MTTSHPERARSRLRRFCLLTFSVTYGVALADDIAPSSATFQSSFLFQPGMTGISAATALEALANEHELGPGRYPVELLVNQTSVGQQELDFFLDTQQRHLKPCLSPALLNEQGLRLDTLPDPALLVQPCLDLPVVVPGARVDFDSAALRLAISIPQIALRREITGYIDPERWDSGITAAFVNYQASTQQLDNRTQGRSSNYDLYLRSGINLGDWRLRSTQSWRQNSDGARSWDRAYTYAQRDLPGTLGTFTLGETFTGSEVFRSVPLLGARVATDFDMLPNLMRSYAPIISGVAQTRAKLEVLQNGYPIYFTYVSPGPYAIDDLSVGGTGELEVVLTEEDGQVRRFTQPYANIDNLLRPGVWRYTAALGRYNPAGDGEAPMLWQGTLAYGTPWHTTFYGGLMASDGYQAQAIGIARDLGSLGAVAFDVTHASSQFDTTADVKGQSYAMKYSKAFNSGTHLRFAGYRYSTEGYRDFDEWVSQRSHDSRFTGSRRSRLESSVIQRLGTRGSLNLTFSQQDYWQRPDVERQFRFSFNTSYNKVNYGLHASQSLSNNRRGSDRMVGLSISLPLDFGRSGNLSFDTQHSANGNRQRASLSGSGSDYRLSYNASVSRDEQQRQALGLNLGYQTALASVGAGVSAAPDYRSLSLNASGSLLAHAGGVEFGPYLSETIGLVEVPNTPGVGVQSASSVRTNARGFALVPSLSPYRSNQLVLQTDQLGPEVEIDNATAQVVPRRGAVVKHRFDVRNVNRLVLTLRSPDGQPVPFGAQVSDSAGSSLGVVGQAGVVMLSTEQPSQQVKVHWSEQAQCQLELDVADMPLDQGYRMQTLTCG
ncbi:fimbria/pilus outer membrane usher protein [Pseudomonas guariconensis]|uniref:fimbria/pilus outer membrane usher protein n=1 Tax=Pseudomonas guariconensis TaxID=1288410 RepID=UPI0018A8FDE2|nr:fimbria/pilus outer membrane usher protein [Pseudomonas guariconensis]MBF8722160.1 fimbrial biogenesis outer membrane usher protein [Pseudomonas guariconensis]